MLRNLLSARLALAALLLASIALFGCAKKQDAAPVSSGTTTAETAKPAGSTPAAESEEHGADAPVAAISAADPVALWHDVRAEQAELGKTIQSAQLGKVHHLAFAIRDRVIALEKAHGPMAKDVAALHHQVELIRGMAANLDEYGDKGDLDKTQTEFASLNAALLAVERSFPAGMLGKP